MTMAPATESVMGSLPRSKAGVGSAVNDTTRQVGGALGVAVIGSVVTSVYASRVGDVASASNVTGSALSTSRASLANALDVASGLPATAQGAFATDVKEAFVGALSVGLRLSATVIVVAAIVVWKFLPARSHDALEFDESGAPNGVADPAIPVAAGGG